MNFANQVTNDVISNALGHQQRSSQIDDQKYTQA
jgi:hypothetical protein